MMGCETLRLFLFGLELKYKVPEHIANIIFTSNCTGLELKRDWCAMNDSYHELLIVLEWN